MRLFVAIELPGHVRQTIAELVHEQRGRLPKARWVRAENVHLTLAFLGELPEETLPALEGALRPTFAERSPFDLQLDSCGRFPPRGRARVAWIGLADSPPLAELQAEVQRVLEREVGLEPERRPFRPHLTVARCSPPWPRRAAEEWERAERSGAPATFRVDRAVLMQSRLAPTGATYTVVQSYRLERAA